MAEFSPNEAQVSAIEEEGKNILVSAGAGSGKTTVLVERVIRMIIEEGVSIDSLIIVTFTKAAAAHMKEKIYSRIREALKSEALSDEAREHLKGQLMRVFSARISTIDSLCMDIVRENFQYVNIDPAFRIADEAEINLLMQDVLKDMIEAHYAHPSDAFLNFVNYYTDKNDASLENIILTMYKFSQSHPEPERWIDEAVNVYLNADLLREGIQEDAEWFKELKKAIQTEEECLLNRALRGIELCNENWGPYPYLERFEKIYESLQYLEGQFFDNKRSKIDEILNTWEYLPRKNKNEEVDDELRAKAQNLYNKEIREGLQTLQQKYFYQSLEEMYRDMRRCSGVAGTIANLTLEFTRRLAEEKRARQIADFNDVAHFALDVLRKRDADDRIVYTEAADSIARTTREIIVDEYQDTNQMQDALIEALSSERFGRPNVFMVGDVKQSIYGFRMACPELFNNKYLEYADGSETGKRIILGENYRSRQEVVDYINLVFEKIMLPSVGGIDYQNGHRMRRGANFPEPVVPDQMIPEILFINGGGADGKTAESYEIATKIEEIVDHYYVKDEDDPETLRKARYSDIAILTRRTNNPRLEKMLTDRHIPVRKSSSKGFFAAFEIRLALDLLKVIDNPYQDIPLAAVLMSPVAGLDANDLAKIKTNAEGEPFRLYAGCVQFCEAKDCDLELAEKLSRFLELLEEWRQKSLCLGFTDFLKELLEESGLYNMCSAMTYGDGRRANLDALRTVAANFQNGSYTGLFNFLRYLDAMQKADMDLGSAAGITGAEDAVTMMTIHKSKGLEFPIVILADGGKQISDLDSSSPIYLDDSIGVGIEYRDLETRIKKKTLMMEIVGAKKKREIFAEEIRLLYVAMSRAKEKLIITGSSGTMKGRIKEWESEGSQPLPDAGSIQKANSYIFLIAEAMKCASDEDKAKFRWTITNFEDVEMERLEEVLDEQARRAEIEKLIDDATVEAGGVSSADEAASAEAGVASADEASCAEAGVAASGVPASQNAGIYDYDYPYLQATRTKIKVTASQMEKHDIEHDSENEERYQYRTRAAAGLTGAERGNAYHKFFEMLDYAFADSAEEEQLHTQVQNQIDALQEKGFLSEEEAAAVEAEHIVEFLHSGIGQRMRKAALNGTLKREQQFVMSAEIDGNPGGLMQGIIDAFFVEEDGAEKHVILVDYKTDRNTDEQYFINTYQPQQEQYAKAIEAALGLPVTEKILYSVELGREIYLP